MPPKKLLPLLSPAPVLFEPSVTTMIGMTRGAASAAGPGSATKAGEGGVMISEVKTAGNSTFCAATVSRNQSCAGGGATPMSATHSPL